MFIADLFFEFIFLLFKFILIIFYLADSVLTAVYNNCLTVINEASSLVKNRIAPVMSSGSPSRLIACCSHVARFISSG